MHTEKKEIGTLLNVPGKHFKLENLAHFGIRQEFKSQGDKTLLPAVTKDEKDMFW